MSRMQTVTVLAKNRPSQETQVENIFEETLGIIEELFNYRLVDRISRPKDKDFKQKCINQFASKMTLLHEKMYRIRREITEANKQDHPQIRNAIIFGTVTTRAKLDWKKSVRLIEAKYNEVFSEGSFKFCRKICDVLGLQFVLGLELILVEDWADECLQSRKTESCC